MAESAAPDMDLGTAFACAVARDPHATALVDGPARRTYADWQGEIFAMAGGLASLGFGRGDHLVAIMSNRGGMNTLYWACQMLGTVFTPFNWRAGADDIAYVLADAEAKLVAFEAAVAQTVRPAMATAGLGAAAAITVDDGGAGTPMADLARAAAVPGPAGAADHDTCLMLYTSGTTGRPKGVPRSQRAERTAAAACIANQRLRFGDAALGVMPLFHTMGIRILLMSAMLGGKFVCMRRFNGGAALELIEAERITSLFLVPTMLHDMVHHDQMAETDCASVRNLAYAGMVMTSALEAACAAAFRPDIFCNYYGSTEIFPFTFCDHLHAKPGCAGRAGINQQIRVVRADAAGAEDVVEAGQVGEVIAPMQGGEAFAGYWKRPDADRAAIREDWYFTGDLGWLDEDGELYLAGRKDDMIISGGENIHPEEVEDVLDASPLVRRAAVVGLADPRLGHQVTAFIEPVGDASAEALDAHCRASTLARFKRPRAYVFVEAIPTSASGKLLRRLLREGDYRLTQGSDVQEGDT